MDRTPVVTCFLRNGGRILLFRRSDAVGSYPDKWGTVTGHLAPERGVTPDDPETATRREIREETGLGDAVTLVRQGEPFDVTDDDRETTWQIHPMLFDCARRDVAPNWETEAWEWVHPTEILRRETVPDLWRSYDRVRPTVETIESDHEHGSAWLSIRALEVLRDEAALGEQNLTALARELRDVRSSMVVLENRINRAMSAADDRSASVVETTTQECIERAVTADRQAATVAAERIAETRVCTLSRSGTVLETIGLADPEAVLIAQSRPGGEGIDVAESLADEYDVTLTSDAALSSRIDTWGTDAVVVGADTVLADGGVLNKVGTRAATLAARRAAIPCYVVAATDKVTPEQAVDREDAPDPLYDGDAPLQVDNPLFEVTPSELFTDICTEEGMLGSEGVERVAQEHRQRGQWDE